VLRILNPGGSDGPAEQRLFTNSSDQLDDVLSRCVESAIGSAFRAQDCCCGDCFWANCINTEQRRHFDRSIAFLI
jgi:hypothetical protein